MYSTLEQSQIRLDIFAWLETNLDDKKWITRNQLENGYQWRGEKIRLVSNQKGIWNPQSFAETLSIMTTADSKYHDTYDDITGNMEYDYEDTDPLGGSNLKLRRACENSTPLIYFKGVQPGIFVAYFPVFVIQDLFEIRKFLVNLKGAKSVNESAVADDEVSRRYAKRETFQRIHQPMFRAKVIYAYKTKCAICRLQHPELLDAAHIAPDRDERGIAAVRNGLSLCKIHHAAYDRNILSITPDYTVQVNSEILEETDGPMLKHGIQDMHGTVITVPASEKEKPDKQLLDWRFKEFLKSAS